MRVRKLYDAEAELFRLETVYLDDEGTFDDNWIVSAGDLFKGMTLPDPANKPTLPSTPLFGSAPVPLRIA